MLSLSDDRPLPPQLVWNMGERAEAYVTLWWWEGLVSSGRALCLPWPQAVVPFLWLLQALWVFIAENWVGVTCG